MLNIRKRLTIQIEESHDNEEEIQMLKIKNEGSLINCDNNSNDCKIKHSDENKHKIKELNHPYINQLLNYMESENSGSDLSYTW